MDLKNLETIGEEEFAEILERVTAEKTRRDGRTDDEKKQEADGVQRERVRRSVEQSVSYRL